VTFDLIVFMIAMTFLGSTAIQGDRITNPFVFVKDSMIAFFEWIGDLGIFCGRLARVVFVPPHEGRKILRQLEAVGPQSFMLVALAGAATGAVLSLQTRDSLTRMGAGALLPSVIVFSLINDKRMYNQATAATAQAQAGAMAFDENMQALSNNFLLKGFFNRRGYENSADLTKYAVSRLPAGSPFKTFVYAGDMIFDKKDTAKLKNKKVLTEAGKFLEANAFGLAVVAGYSGMKGDSGKNKVLMQARTMVVREYLVQNFKLNDTRLATIGMGESNESSDSGKIEILIYPADATASPVEKKGAEKH
jgi:outer membrane protein OmpA-like peptidoglycan-associated protein